MLSIDWPENQRGGASLFVNDEKKEIPADGADRDPASAVEGAVPVSFRSGRGFQPKTFCVASPRR